MSPDHAPVIDFDALLRLRWDGALQLVKRHDEDLDAEAMKALNDETYKNRQGKILEWLQYYKVFRVPGIANQKGKIVDAVLKFADSRDHMREMDSPDALSDAHEELMKLVCDAYVCESQNKRRNFISLASKALWLCYPDKVPMFDTYAQRALFVVAKLETGLRQPPKGDGYRPFVSVWKNLYERHQPTIDSLPMDGYCHRVRVLDRILWQLGMEQYTIPVL